MVTTSRRPVIPAPKSPYARPSKRLPRVVTNDGAFAAGLIAGHAYAVADTVTTPQSALNDAWHRGHQAGMYAAMALLAEHLGVTL